MFTFEANGAYVMDAASNLYSLAIGLVSGVTFGAFNWTSVAESNFSFNKSPEID